MTVVCPRCLANAPDTANFCDMCGTRLRALERSHPSGLGYPPAYYYTPSEALQQILGWWQQLSPAEQLYVISQVMIILHMGGVYARDAAKQLREWWSNRKRLHEQQYIR